MTATSDGFALVSERAEPFEPAGSAQLGPDLERSLPGAWWTVAVTFLLYLFSHVDRTIITMLVAPIKHDLGIGDFQIGLLLGPAFGLFFAVCGLLMGMAVDRFSRRNVIYCGVTAWSASASLCGLASSYALLFLGRAGVGVGEATLTPAAYSLISDLVPRRKLAFALSAFSSAVVVGTAVALVGGGWAIEFLKNGRAPFGLATWQFLFLATGVPGFFLALLAFTITDPRRRSGAALRADGSSFIAHLRAQPRLYFAIYVGTGLMVVDSYALLGWLPTYLMRNFGLGAQAAGMRFGLVVVIAGGIGQLASGLIVDRMTARGIADAPLRFLMIAGTIMLPFTVGAFFVTDSTLFLLLISAFFLLAMPMLGYIGAGVQMVTPPRLRGRASAGLLFTVTLFGVAFGPTLVGFLTDYVFRDPLKLGLAQAVVVAVVTPLSVLVLGSGLRSFRDAQRH